MKRHNQSFGFPFGFTEVEWAVYNQEAVRDEVDLLKRSEKKKVRSA